MRKGLFSLIIMLAAILLLVLAGCYMPGGPVPEEKHPPASRAWTTADVDAAVTMTMEKIYSPAPTTNGTPPGECNYIHYLRFRPKTGSANMADADAIIVLIPGLAMGATSLECIGREMVYMALEQRGKHIEVWALDRRPNNLEDLTGLNAAQEAYNTQVAIDYYYNGVAIDGKKFAGYLTNADVPYLSEFGLELVIKDVYTLITTNVPDPAMRRQKVFVGGHSMGGPFAALFAGWDFDGNPETLDDAGYMNCAGLIGLDTLLRPDAFSPGALTLQAFNLDPLTAGDEEFYQEMIQGIREGQLPRMILSSGHETYGALELSAMEAAWHPDAESTLLDRIPLSPSLRLLLQVLHSRNIENFFNHVPSIKDFRFTNEALFGVLLDNNFNPITILQTSMGFLNGGAVVQKEFPPPQYIALIPSLKNMINMDGQFIANDAGPSQSQLGTGPLYTWANFDEVGNAADPNYMSTDGSITYSTVTEEVSDIQDVARSMFHGPTDAFELYFSYRLICDFYAAGEPFGPDYGLNYLHGDEVAGVPQIDFVAENGPLAGSVDNLPLEIRVIEGYNHFDVCTASPERPSRRPNEVIDPVLDFIFGG